MSLISHQTNTLMLFFGYQYITLMLWVNYTVKMIFFFKDDTNDTSNIKLEP